MWLQHPELPLEELQKLKQKFGHLFPGPLYPHMLRDSGVCVKHMATIPSSPTQRLSILNRFAVLLFDYLNFPRFLCFSADRSMHFLTRSCKLGRFGQPLKVNATTQRLGDYHNLRTFLPDKHAGKSLVEVFGVQLRGILGWMNPVQ